MAKPVSPKPLQFGGPHEQDYWHMAQDTAFRMGASILLEDGATWLISENGRELLKRPEKPERVWYETWFVLHNRFPTISRLWIGGRPLESR